MISADYPIKSPENPSKKLPEIHGNCPGSESLFSPGFRSVAAMAGWDEEALLVASLIVEDTPDRQFKPKRRSVFRSSKTPPSHSRRKCKAQRQSSASIPVAVLDLDDKDEPKSKQENEKTNTETNKIEEVEEKKAVDDEVNSKDNGVSSSSLAIPCIDRLREELSCAICLEICYEPSTTPCGHSFCKKCLHSAADRCGKKCPKCRNFISNGKYCTVNTVLWNTIQLLFPLEVEARKTTESTSESREPQGGIPTRTRDHNMRNRVVEALNSPESERNNAERRRNHHRIRSRSSRAEATRAAVLPNQDEDAALALRLQREELLGVYRQEPDARRNSASLARANLRAMASRAINIRIRGRRD